MENATRDTLSAAIYDWAAAKRFKVAEHRLYKTDRSGWQYRTIIFIGMATVDGKSKVRTLTITTDKFGGARRNVSCYASVSHSEGGFSTYRIFNDWARELRREVTTSTEKAVRTQHELTVTPQSLDALLLDIESTYIGKGEPLTSTFYPAV